MPNWDFWGWLAYASIALSAFILAIRECSKDMTSPSWVPNFFIKINWSYIPLILIVISLLIFISKQYGWIGIHKPVNEVQFTKFPVPYRPISVIGKKFRNEKIIIDGYSYDHCEFINVTFVYDGTTPFHFTNNKVSGYLLGTNNPAVFGSIALLKAFGQLPDNFAIELPPGNILEKPVMQNDSLK